MSDEVARMRGGRAAAVAIVLLALGALALLTLRPAAPPPTYAVRVRAVAEGLGDDGSRVPLRVTGETAAGEAVDLRAYVGASGGTVEVEAGSYEVAVAGSPIAADGQMYTWEGAALEVEIPEGTDASEEVVAPGDLELPPVGDDAGVTDDEIEAAAALVRADPERGDEAADGLAGAATARRDAALSEREAAAAAEEAERAEARAAARAYALALPGAATFFARASVSAGYTDTYRYALVDMDGDGARELLICADYTALGNGVFYLVLVRDPSSGLAYPVGEAIQQGPRTGVLAAADGRGLVVSSADVQGDGTISESSSRCTLEGGQIVYGDADGAAGVELELHDAADLAPLAELAGGEAPDTDLGTRFECAYFAVEVPASWAGQWSVTQLAPASWQFGESATVEYDSEGDAIGAAAAELVVAAEAPDPYYRALGTTSGGLTVWAFEAGGSFFDHPEYRAAHPDIEWGEGATLTAK